MEGEKCTICMYVKLVYVKFEIYKCGLYSSPFYLVAYMYICIYVCSTREGYSKEIRVGISQAYLHALRDQGPAYVEKNVSFIVAHLLNVCSGDTKNKMYNTFICMLCYTLCFYVCQVVDYVSSMYIYIYIYIYVYTYIHRRSHIMYNTYVC